MVPAEAMGAAADLGSVERGKLADLVLCENPAEARFQKIAV